MKISLSALLLLSFCFQALAQPVYIDKKNNREYFIYRDTDPEMIEDFLKSVKAEAIEFSPFDDTYLLKNKEGKWNLYSDLQEQMTFKGYDSIGFVTPDVPFTVVKNLNKYGILKSPFKYENVEAEVRYTYNEIRTVTKDGVNYLIARIGKKWAQIDWETGVNFTPFIYFDFREIEYIKLTDEELQFIAAIRKKKGFDYVEFDRVNGNEIYRARQSRLRKWGMYKGFNVNEVQELIPGEFDSLEFFPSNNNFTVVYLAGKMGFYNKIDDTVKKISAPDFEAYKRVDFNGEVYLAVQKQGKWGWMDWFDGEIKIKSISPSFEELPQPDWRSKFYTQK